MRTHRIKKVRIPYTWAEIAKVVIALVALSSTVYAALSAGNALP